MPDVLTQLEETSKLFRLYLYKDPERAFALMGQNARLAEAHGEHRWQVSALIAQCEVRLLNGRHTEAFAIIDPVIPLARELGDAEMLAKAHGVRAVVRRNMGEDITSVIEEIQLARTHALGTDVVKLKAWLLMTLADTYSQADPLESLRYSQELLQLEGATPSQKATAFVYLGRVHGMLENHETVVDVTQQALDLLKDSNEVNTITSALNMLGFALLGMGDRNGAIEKFEEVLSYNAGKNLNPALIHLGEAYLDAGDIETAKTYYTRSLETESHYRNDLDAKSALGKIMLMEGRPQEALAYLLPLEEYATGTPDNIKMRYYGVLADALAALYKWQLAHDYLKKRTNIQQELQHLKFQYHLKLLHREATLERERLQTERVRMHAEQLEQRLTANALQAAAQVEVMTNLRQDVLTIMREEHDPFTSLKRIQNRMKMLPCEQVDWGSFEREFNSANPEFTSRLEARFPGLSPMEVRVCSMLKLGLKTNDVARLFCITPRAIEFHRFNLRKKFNLRKEDSLQKFLSGVVEGTPRAADKSRLGLVPSV